MIKGNKTHAQMIKEAVEYLGSAKPKAIIKWISEKYTNIEINKNSFRADIIGCSVNHSSSHHFPSMPEFLYFDKQTKTYQLYDPKKHNISESSNEDFNEPLKSEIDNSISFYVKGKSATFATKREKEWKENLGNQIPDYNTNCYEKGLIIDFHFTAMEVNGHPFDVDNLCEPVFSVLINKKGWFKGARPNLQWFRASKIKNIRDGCEILISNQSELKNSVKYKKVLFDRIFDGNLPKNATDNDFISWVKNNSSGRNYSNHFYLKIEFGNKDVNLGDIATGKIKSIIDCLFPVIGGKEKSPEDWKVYVLDVRKGVETLPEDAVRIFVAES